MINKKIIIGITTGICFLAGLSIFAYMYSLEDYEGQKICETYLSKSSKIKDVKASCVCLHNIIEKEQYSMKRFFETMELYDKNVDEDAIYKSAKERKTIFKILVFGSDCFK